MNVSPAQMSVLLQCRLRVCCNLWVWDTNFYMCARAERSTPCPPRNHLKWFLGWSGSHACEELPPYITVFCLLTDCWPMVSSLLCKKGWVTSWSFTWHLCLRLCFHLSSWHGDLTFLPAFFLLLRLEALLIPSLPTANMCHSFWIFKAWSYLIFFSLRKDSVIPI